MKINISIVKLQIVHHLLDSLETEMDIDHSLCLPANKSPEVNIVASCHADVSIQNPYLTFTSKDHVEDFNTSEENTTVHKHWA